MKVSLNWLGRYVDIKVPLEQLCDKMVQAGFEVDGLRIYPKPWIMLL